MKKKTVVHKMYPAYLTASQNHKRRPIWTTLVFMIFNKRLLIATTMLCFWYMFQTNWKHDCPKCSCFM